MKGKGRQQRRGQYRSEGKIFAVESQMTNSDCDQQRLLMNDIQYVRATAQCKQLVNTVAVNNLPRSGLLSAISTKLRSREV